MYVSTYNVTYLFYRLSSNNSNYYYPNLSLKSRDLSPSYITGASYTQGWARDGTRQSHDSLTRSRLPRGTTMRESPAKICPGPDRPADFCPGPGPTGHKKRRDRSGLASRGTVPRVPTYIS